ncbi:hypothetical protein AB0D74_31635 [Streptomyces sp. NPDC048278]|uniref:hypothetical protein n=1 Tax=Streptomyces sp. NPDC048278 TaxID=3155809 RepID=UPI00344347DC
MTEVSSIARIVGSWPPWAVPVAVNTEQILFTGRPCAHNGPVVSMNFLSRAAGSP